MSMRTWLLRQLQGSSVPMPRAVSYGGTGFPAERQRQLEPPERYESFNRMESVVPAVTMFEIQMAALLGSLTFTVSGRNKVRAVDSLGALLTPDALVGIGKAVSTGLSIVEFSLGPNGIDKYAILPPSTIHRMLTDSDGEVVGFEQRIDGRPVVIPRNKTVYSTFGPGPYGKGVYLKVAFDGLAYINNRDRVMAATDDNLRRRPNLRHPYTTSGVGKDVAEKLETVVLDKNTDVSTRFSLPSQPWESYNVAGDTRFAPAEQWQLEYPPAVPIEDNDLMEQIQQRIATVLGVEAFFLGQTAVGSYALAETQRTSFTAIVHFAIALIEASLQRTLGTIFNARGWGTPPMLVADTVELPDPQKLADVVKVVSDSTRADIDSPGVEYILERLGLPPIQSESEDDPAPSPPPEEEEAEDG